MLINNSELYSCRGHLSTTVLHFSPVSLSFWYFDQKRRVFAIGLGDFHKRTPRTRNCARFFPAGFIHIFNESIISYKIITPSYICRVPVPWQNQRRDFVFYILQRVFSPQIQVLFPLFLYLNVYSCSCIKKEHAFRRAPKKRTIR